MRYIRINITLPPEDLAQLDRLAREVGLSRSELIRDAVRAFRPADGGARRRTDPEEVRGWLRTVRLGLPAPAAEAVRRLRGDPAGPA